MTGIPRPLGCPFCGVPPSIQPDSWKADGDAWASVNCITKRCPANPSIRIIGKEGSLSGTDASELHKKLAVEKWNTSLRSRDDANIRSAHSCGYSAGVAGVDKDNDLKRFLQRNDG